MAMHRDVMKDVQALWAESGYTTPGGIRRLRMIYESDIARVSAARIEPGVPTVPSFDALKPCIGEAVARIEEHAGNPVIIVNGDKDLQANQQHLDFDTGSVWRILIGGTKLSRGFTVEGLTVSYYRRITTMHDTLTQAGRWFGFRYGYRDLVRVHIGRDEKFGTKRVDLLEAFDAVVQDEEEFRTQLRSYSQLVDGRPQMRPIDIPPLVSQHLFWLKPTATNKMFNAVLEEQHDAEFGLDGHPKDPASLIANLQLWTPILQRLSDPFPLRQTGADGKPFPARCALASFDELAELLDRHQWLEYYRERVVMPRLSFLAALRGKVDDFLVICPQPTGPTVSIESVAGVDQLAVVQRRRRPERGDVMGEPTDPKHRGPAMRIVSNKKDDPYLDAFYATRRGAVLAYAMRDMSEGADPTRIMGFRIFLPYSVVQVDRPYVRFRAKQPLRGVVVDSRN
jgi:Z1 domain